jgi:hypothetical protein
LNIQVVNYGGSVNLSSILAVHLKLSRPEVKVTLININPVFNDESNFQFSSKIDLIVNLKLMENKKFENIPGITYYYGDPNSISLWRMFVNSFKKIDEVVITTFEQFKIKIINKELWYD